MSLRRKVVILALSVGLPACDPYKNLSGDYFIGPIDTGCPANQPSGAGTSCTPFPAAYEGFGFTAASSSGVIMPFPAGVAGGGTVLYYPFTVNAAVTNPTVLRTQTMDASGNPVIKDRAPAYIFDTAAGAWNGQDSAKCTPPSPDYMWDQRVDTFPLNRQLNVFQQRQSSKDPAALPSDSGYQPIYAEVPVTSNGEACESIHSADGLMDQNGKGVTVSMTDPAPIGSPFFRPVGHGDGSYLALAVIDPVSDVLTVPDPGLPSGNPGCPSGSSNLGGAPFDTTGACHDPKTHLGPVHYGFLDHFLVGYIEGGYVPTAMKTVPGTGGKPDTQVVVAQENVLYAPNVFVDPTSGMPTPCNPADPANLDPTMGCIGHGLDLIDGIMGKVADRSKPNNGYSPLCHVMTYTPQGGDPANAATDPTMIDPMSLDMDAGVYVYCLQTATATK